MSGPGAMGGAAAGGAGAVGPGARAGGSIPATIAIPTYAQAGRLAEAIGSALAQTHPRLEVLVLDDASPDDTPAVTARFAADPRVRVIRHPANVGRVANYRHALAAARGEWVLVLDGDDVLLDRDFLADALAEAAADPDVVLVVGGQRWRETADARHLDGYPTRRACERLDGWTFFRRWRSPLDVVPHLAAVYSAAPARALDFYARDILSSDWESLRRLCLHGRVVLLHRLAGEWRGHAANASRRLDPEAHLANLDAILLPAAEAVRLGHAGAGVRAWETDALRRYAAAYLEAALTAGEPALAAAFARGLRARLGGRGGAIVRRCWATRPSLWAKALLGALGGRPLLAAARRAWRGLVWTRGEPR